MLTPCSSRSPYFRAGAPASTYPRRRLLALVATLLVVLLPARASLADAADPAFWYATASDGSPRIKLHFFWTSRCPHCQAAKPFMEALPSRLPYVDVVSHPTEGDAANARLQYATATALGADPTSVPAIFFCGKAQIGYDSAETTGAALVQQLDACRSRLAADPSLLTKPVPVIATDQRAGSGGGSTFALVIGAAFVALVVAGVVLAKKSAAAKARADAARRAHRGEGGKRRGR